MLHELLHIVATLPLDDPIPNPGPAAPPGLSGPAGLLIGAAKWGGLVLCVIALIVAGAILGFRMRRGEAGEHFTAIMGALIGAAIITGAVSLIGWINS